MVRPKDIGSDFNIPFKLLSNKKLNKLSLQPIYLSTGRDCLTYIIKQLELKSVLLPSYLCGAILEPFNENKVKYGFYKVKDDLSVDLDDLRKKKDEFSAVLIINYFGFPQKESRKIKEICKINNVFLIEDLAHSFLSDVEPVGDLVFNSYRKFFPLPDGAFLLTNLKRIKTKKSLKHFLYVFSKLSAGLMKNFKSLKPIYYPLFIKSENKMISSYCKPVKMSFVSKFILKRIDFSKIFFKRKSNYYYLADKMKKIRNVRPVHSKLPDNVCPLGLPIIFKSNKVRDKVRGCLVRERIYPPIHWKIPNIVDKREFKTSHDISSKVMTIPIDQRYGKKDMRRILRIIKDGL